MALILTQEQKDLRDMVKKFMNAEVKPYQKEFDLSGEFPVEMYKKGFELGFHLMTIPEEFGGLGLSHQTVCIMLEEMGKVEPAYAISLLASILAFECVLACGTEEQKAIFADKMLPGAFASFCMTEPDSGSDSASIRATAVKDGDDYIINGTKCFISNAGIADIYVVFATVDRSLGAKGICAFLLEKGMPGLSGGKHEDKMGLRLSNTAEVVLQDVRVPASRLIGKVGEGFKVAMLGLDASRTHNGAITTGLSQGAIDEAAKYAKERIQFGKPIMAYQAISFSLADMAMQTEAGRQLVHGAAKLLDAGMKATSESSMAKCFCSDNAMKVTTEAVQIMGGYGYMREYPLEKKMRDAKIFQIIEGTNQVQRMIIARELGKQQ